MKNKRVPALLLAIITTLSVLFTTASADGVPFTDVKTGDWFYNDVRLAYETGLINGKSPTVFAPNDDLTYAEAVKLAACMRVAYLREEPLTRVGANWYDVYVQYCWKNNIITKTYDWNAKATRGEYMQIFAAALPNTALKAINDVEDGEIPDVPMTHKNADAIYKLYRAGVVQGVDFYCLPERNVERSEVSAILTRMMYEKERIGFTIDADKPGSTGNSGSSNSGSNNSGSSNSGSSGGSQLTKYPWDKNGAKQPSEYTLAEYEKLTASQQRAFRSWFKTQSAFELWKENASKVDTPVEVNPWEVPGAKQPKDYTWMEYQQLTTTQKGAFAETFASSAEFRSWQDAKYEEMVNGGTEETPSGPSYPWDAEGAKKPNAYTWAEYQELTTAEQEAFYDWFGSSDAFTAWQSGAQDSAGEADMPWDKTGAKKPNAYTWAQYQALTAAQKEAFYDWFGSSDAFTAWQSGAQGSAGDLDLPWEKGGKDPDRYTKEEYEDLTPAQKEAFYDWFGSAEAFDAWMNGGSETDLPWEKGGKDPDRYTKEEYEDLTPAQKEAFYDWFGSADAFDAWLNGSGSDNPWEDGGKKPNRYTWEEYEDLTPEQKEAFYDWFGSADAFDAWMQDAQDSGSDYPWDNGGKLPSEYTMAEFEALGEMQEAFVDWFGSMDAFEAWLNSAQQPKGQR